MSKKAPKKRARKYKHDTPITFWLSMHSNHTAKESDTSTVGEWLGHSAEEVEKLSDDEIESELDEAEGEWLVGQVDHGWYKGEADRG